MAHLTLSHRQKIAEGIRLGKSNARIARELAVSPSTIGREISRNADSRETYAAGFAQTMAASRQILAARDRFICAAEVYKPSAYCFSSTPYAFWSLPSLAGWRESDPFTYRFSEYTSSFYFHPKEHYLTFTRFDKVSGLFRPSGERILPVTMRWDARVRDASSSSSGYSSNTFAPGSFSNNPSSSVLIADTTSLTDGKRFPVESFVKRTASLCAFASISVSKNINSPAIPVKTKRIIVPAKNQEGRSLLFAA